MIAWFAIYAGAASAVSDNSADTINVGVVDEIERELNVVDGELVGRFSPLYRCVFGAMDGQFKFVEMPLARLLFQLENGQVSIGLPLVQTLARDKFADFGGLLFQAEYVYLFIKDLPPFSQASGLTFALVRRFVGEDLMRGEAAKLLSVSGWRQAVNMLKIGRADAVVLPWVLVENLMKGFEGEYFVRTAKWVDLSLYVSHAHGDRKLTRNIRRAISQCRYNSDTSN